MQRSHQNTNDAPTPEPTRFAVDPALVAFTKRHWKPVDAETDPDTPSFTIDGSGRLNGGPPPAVEPETLAELLTMLSLRSLKPLPLSNDPDMKPRLPVGPRGEIQGPTGFQFRPETPAERAFLEERPR